MEIYKLKTAKVNLQVFNLTIGVLIICENIKYEENKNE